MTKPEEFKAAFAKLPWYGKALIVASWWTVAFSVAAIISVPPLWLVFGISAAKVGLAVAWVTGCVAAGFIWLVLT